jgi:hypothetical protein
LLLTVAERKGITQELIMKHNLISCRLTTQAARQGFFNLLLTLMLATASFPAFSARFFSSGNGNVAPVISGTPPTSVVTGDRYDFQPSATDANGNKLKFQISNMPAWASFSSRTGELSGTPGASDVGTYSNIVISVSDRRSSASLPAFGITVQPAPVQTGSMSLQWTAPVTRADGTPLSLSDIGGYRVYYGTSAGSYPNKIDVADGTAQTITITDLPVGSYRLVMTSYDANGLESAYSSMVTKNAQ